MFATKTNLPHDDKMKEKKRIPRRTIMTMAAWHRKTANYRRPSSLSGGLASTHRMTLDSFERAGFLGELQRGTAIESEEHTTPRNFNVAVSIAMDHMTENMFYYQYLEEMEKRMDEGEAR